MQFLVIVDMQDGCQYVKIEDWPKFMGEQFLLKVSNSGIVATISVISGNMADIRDGWPQYDLSKMVHLSLIRILSFSKFSDVWSPFTWVLLALTSKFQKF